MTVFAINSYSSTNFKFGNEVAHQESEAVSFTKQQFFVAVNPLLVDRLNEKSLTEHAMRLSESSLTEDWKDEDDEHWNSFLIQDELPAR